MSGFEDGGRKRPAPFIDQRPDGPSELPLMPIASGVRSAPS
jgi:hypothetical protein